MTDFFHNIYLWINSKKALSIVLLVILVSVLGFLASKIEFEEDISKLIPTNSQNQDAQKVLKTVNFADKIIVNITRKDNASIDDLTTFASQFLDSLHANSSTYFTKVQGQIPDETVYNTLDFVYNNLPLFLDENDYSLIANKLRSDSIAAITKANYKSLVSPSGIVTKESILKDPLGLSFMALKKLQQLSFGDAFILENGFLLSRDKKHIVLFITPKHKSSETSENAIFAEKLYTLKDKLNAAYSGSIDCEYFGGALIAVANAKQIKRDIQITVGIAMSILLLILIVFYKKLSIPLILFTPTAFGALLAVALLFVIRTKISAISLGIGSVLLGITLDYALHILTHIRSNNNIKALYKDITKPILMSSLTTALAFLCLLFLESQALQDLGVFAAISVLGASVFSLVFIPQVYKNSSISIKKKTPLDVVAHYPFHSNKWLLLGLVVIFIVSAFTYHKTTFNNDISQLNYEPKDLLEAQKRLDALTNISSKSIYLATYGNTLQQAIETNDTVFGQLKTLKQNQDVIDFSSIGALVQSTKKQHEKLQTWQDFWNPERLTKTKQDLIDSGTSLGFKPNTFHRFYELLETPFSTLTLPDYKTLNTLSIDDYITTRPDFTTVTSLVKVKDSQIGPLVKTFNEKPNTLVIDRKHMNETFLGGLKQDFNELVGYSLIVVLLLLLAFYRSVSLTLVTALPIALTWLTTIGIMGILGVQFNIFNIIISTFIFGLGIDYSIFITNGLLHELKTGEPVLPTHKTSIILSVITTILGVGVLVFAKHPALFSISMVSIIGIFSALCIAFILQPILFRFFIGSKYNRPAPLLMFIHSCISFTYYGLGGFLLSLLGIAVMKIIPISKKFKMKWFHKVMSKFMKSVLDSYPFFKTKVLNPNKETFEKQAVIIANHTSFLDILAIGMLHPKIIFLVNDWVYNSPFFGKAVKLAGFYPVSSGIENGVSHLQRKVDQGYSLMVFPEGTRTYTHKMKRFHKGAFFLAEQYKLDIVPVIIHGNSEILPKGNFVIKSGKLTLDILERIPFNDTRFGSSVREKTKTISTFFKAQFKAFRSMHEEADYFHNMVLEDYHYKGDLLYKTIKQDLSIHQDIYKTILDNLGDKEHILHLSNAFGQLDFLLAVHAPSRHLNVYLEDADMAKMVEHSYISNNHYHIQVLNAFPVEINESCKTLIIDNVVFSSEAIEKLLSGAINQVILLFESTTQYKSLIVAYGFNVTQESNNLIILKKN